MELHVLGSGSKGNSYLLTSSTGQRLLIDLGVEWQKIREAMDCDFDNCYALVSHSHGDHARCFQRFAKVCWNVFSSIKTASEVFMGDMSAENVELPNTRIFMPYDPFYAGEFRIVAFPLHHDVETHGFLIYHPECGTICFITDTMKAETADGRPFDFKNVSWFFVESNYCQEILIQNVTNGMNPILAERVVKSHFSIQHCERMLLDQDLSTAEGILLLHLSNGNSNAVDFKRRIEASTGVPTHIAEAGLKLNLDWI